MAAHKKPYKLNQLVSFTAKQFKKQSRANQIEVMRNWFYEHYTDPVNNCPYISAEGGYQFIWGGPYQADEVLYTEFGELSSDKCIAELIDELEYESLLWSRVDYGNDQWDEYLESILLLNTDQEFYESIANVEKLLLENISKPNKSIFLRLIFANIITILETYLSDTFIKLVTKCGKYFLKYYVEKQKKKNKKILISDYEINKALFDKGLVKYFTTGFCWHNLDRAEEQYNLFDVNFTPYKELLKKPISLRHDIIHRNGKNSDYILIDLSIKDIKNLIKNVKSFVDHLHSEIEKKLKDNHLIIDNEWIIDDSPF